MAGLGFDNAMPKLISAKTHSVIDYVHVATNFAVAAILWKKNRAGAWAAAGLGTGVLMNTLMTDYPLGVFRLWDFKVHGALDYSAAALSAALPTVLGFGDAPEAKFFQLQGLGEAGIAGVSNYADETIDWDEKPA